MNLLRKIFPNRKRVVWVSVAAVALGLLAFGGAKVYRILYTPQDLFPAATTKPAVTATSAPSATLPGLGESPQVTKAPDLTPTPAPTPGITESTDILNIMLIGIDRSQTEGKGSGRDPHSDVMMVLAINFKKKTADLISLPRDTFVHAPQIMNGVYKLNASLNVGGGFAAPNGAGFMKVCEAAKYMLGGLSVDYYYAVDFTSLVQVIDTIGGVDYEVENRAYSLQHKKGMQHMNGADVLFYLRTRKVGPEQGDSNRVKRQKKLLVAIFEQLKKNGKLSMVPDLVSSARSGIYTNTNLEQTLALANFAKGLNPDKIGMYSMEGPRYDSGGWRYTFTDQKQRQTIIKTVYGIDVPEQTHCSHNYAVWLMNYGLDSIRSLKTVRKLLDDAGIQNNSSVTAQQAAKDTLNAYLEAQAAYERASLSLSSADRRKMASEIKAMRAAAEKLAKLIDYKEKLVWQYSRPFWLDPAINEVDVDFR